MKNAVDLADFFAPLREVCVASLVLLASTHAAVSAEVEGPAASPPALRAAVTDATALIRADSRHPNYRRLPRSEARMPDEDDARRNGDVGVIARVALDAPRNASALNRRSATNTATSLADANADGVVQPHQTYALMSAGLLSMALVMIRRRRH